MTIEEALKPLASKLVDSIRVAVEAKKATLEQEAKAAEVNLADYISAMVIKAIPTGGLVMQVAGPEVKKAIENLTQEIIAAMGGENEVIFNLVDQELKTIEKALGG